MLSKSLENTITSEVCNEQNHFYEWEQETKVTASVLQSLHFKPLSSAKRSSSGLDVRSGTMFFSTSYPKTPSPRYWVPLIPELFQISQVKSAYWRLGFSLSGGLSHLHIYLLRNSKFCASLICLILYMFTPLISSISFLWVFQMGKKKSAVFN